MAMEFRVIIERDAEGDYVASVPGRRGCHKQARSLDRMHVPSWWTQGDPGIQMPHKPRE